MSDASSIKATIQTYYDSAHESNAEKVHAAFHPAARITGYINDELHEMTTREFAEFAASQQPSPKDKGDAARLEIVSLEVFGNIAAAKVRDDYLGMTFIDVISLLKVDGQWRIYNKLFHVEGPSG